MWSKHWLVGWLTEQTNGRQYALGTTAWLDLSTPSPLQGLIQGCFSGQKDTVTVESFLAKTAQVSWRSVKKLQGVSFKGWWRLFYKNAKGKWHQVRLFKATGFCDGLSLRGPGERGPLSGHSHQAEFPPGLWTELRMRGLGSGPEWRSRDMRSAGGKAVGAYFDCPRVPSLLVVNWGNCCLMIWKSTQESVIRREKRGAHWQLIYKQHLKAGRKHTPLAVMTYSEFLESPRRPQVLGRQEGALERWWSSGSAGGAPLAALSFALQLTI